MGPTWGPPGSSRPQVGPMLAPKTLLSGNNSQRKYPKVMMNHNQFRLVAAPAANMDGKPTTK